MRGSFQPTSLTQVAALLGWTLIVTARSRFGSLRERVRATLHVGGEASTNGPPEEAQAPRSSELPAINAPGSPPAHAPS